MTHYINEENYKDWVSVSWIFTDMVWTVRRTCFRTHWLTYKRKRASHVVLSRTWLECWETTLLWHSTGYIRVQRLDVAGNQSYFSQIPHIIELFRMHVTRGAHQGAEISNHIRKIQSVECNKSEVINITLINLRLQYWEIKHYLISLKELWFRTADFTLVESIIFCKENET